MHLSIKSLVLLISVPPGQKRIAVNYKQQEECDRFLLLPRKKTTASQYKTKQST